MSNDKTSSQKTSMSVPVSSPTPQSVSPTVQVTNFTTVPYSLPAGWETIVSSDGVFQMSYDPQQFIASTSNGEIFLNNNAYVKSLAYYFTIKPYSGGSRHQKIYDYSGGGKSIVWEKTYEKDYRIDGRSSLVLYNVDASMTTDIGVVIMDNKRLLYMNSGIANQAITEKILGTFMVLK